MKNPITKVLIIIAVAFYSCNKTEPVCPDTQSFDFKLILVRLKDSTTTRLKFYHPDFDSINISDKHPTIVSIPVNITGDSTAFFIDFINDTAPQYNKTDLITFTYTDSLYLNYQECGFIQAFKIKKSGTTINNIDSAKQINPYINEENEGNLEIYY